MQRNILLFTTLAAVFILSVFFSWSKPSSVQAGIPDKGYGNALEGFSQVACTDEDLFHYTKGLIRALNYTNRRALVAFSRIDCIAAEDLVASLRRLLTTTISFDNVLLLERFVTLHGADVQLSWQFLEKLDALGYLPGRVVTAFELVDVLTAVEFLDYIDRIDAMSEPGSWAVKLFVELPGHSRASIGRGIQMVEGMPGKQQWATEQCCKVKGMNAYKALDIMAVLSGLSDTDAWNARGLMKQDIDPDAVFSWVQYYFNEDQQQKEWLFFSQSPVEKALLLKGLAEASDYLTWKINDLHSVTDLRGREIAAAALTGGSVSSLERIWKRLDWKVREKYKGSFYQALHSGKKGSAVVVLRKATAKARVQAALDVTTANIYILLSKGSELYDSSFRDILVPILKERIDKRFGLNLLQFLLDVDPENNHVSDFIISLAQRGKLAVFFPEDPREQKLVLDLVIESAFQDENSLILFSATFMKLLETIGPETRSYLIGEMLAAIREQNTVFSMQLRVILQYYLEYYSEFVGEVDRIRINMMMYEFGAVPLHWYTKTAFTEWKADGRLSSLSVFHDDDDGRQSFLSNCRFLSRQGYRPRLSVSYHLGSSAAVNGEAAALLRSYVAAPSKILQNLFRLQVRNPLVLDWVKKVNGIEISHSVFVFQGDGMQQRLLKQFLTGGHEMFAQRGHSYWRSEQLTAPISQLLESGELSSEDLQKKQRFMSLGSCGGIRSYSELATLFDNNVDILATVGTGKAVINNPYNEFLFETVAQADGTLSWDEISDRSAKIFKQGLGEDYLQPGSLPAILHKIMDQKSIDHGTD